MHVVSPLYCVPSFTNVNRIPLPPSPPPHVETGFDSCFVFLTYSVVFLETIFRNSV